MRYWAYMNKEVLGPFEKEQLAKLPDFTASSLICPETPPAGQANTWKEASACPEVAAILAAPAPAPVKLREPAAESPLELTMRGSLISEPAAESPLALTMRGSLIPEPAAAEPPAVSPLKPITVLKPGVLEPPKETPKPGVPGKQLAAPGSILARKEQDPRPEPLKQQLEQMGAALASIGENQTQLLGRLSRLETAVMEIKALLSSEPPKK